MSTDNLSLPELVGLVLTTCVCRANGGRIKRADAEALIAEHPDFAMALASDALRARCLAEIQEKSQ